MCSDEANSILGYCPITSHIAMIENQCHGQSVIAESCSMFSCDRMRTA